jgi:preprotein translocase subunit SecF
MKQFSIMKRSLLWLIIGVAIMASSIVLFVVNMRWSIEFTGGVSLTLDTETSDEQVYSVVDDVMSQYSDDYTIGIDERDE